jgi:hypothetical protein
VSDGGAWLTLALLGAFHGINPAMGWLFAVALGLQEGRRGAVLRALPPIALGHLASVAIVVATVAAARTVVPPGALRIGGALVLVAFGLYRYARRFAHPRWVGMRVGARQLVAWSWLMSTAHGAGLMLIPVLLRWQPVGGVRDGSPHAPGAGAQSGATSALAALTVHTLAMLAVMATVAVIVFEVLGLELLRRAWINLDLVWSVALVAAGVATLVVG